jgi:hypothetical protein
MITIASIVQQDSLILGLPGTISTLYDKAKRLPQCDHSR